MAKKSSWIAGLFRAPGIIAFTVFCGPAFLGTGTSIAAGPAATATATSQAPPARVHGMDVATSVRRAVIPDAASLVVPGAGMAAEQQILETAAAPAGYGGGWNWHWQPLQEEIDAVLRRHIPLHTGVPRLYQAVLQDDRDWLVNLLGVGANPNESTFAGDTALVAAIRLSHVECVRALLQGGADPGLPGLEKQPPIAVASLRRGPEIMAALLAAGADPNTRFNAPVTAGVLERVAIKDLRRTLESDRGVTLLMCCAARGDVEGAVELLNAGAKPGLCTMRHKRYPINFAAVQGYLFLMRIILGRQPESEPEILVTINLSQQRAWLMKEGRIVDSCAVSTGRAGYDTPSGRYVITDKHRSWTSTLYHVAMPYFMRLNCGAIGLHSGYVTGRPASHGCIRLPHAKAQKFFAMVRVGDEVQIVR